MAVIDSPALNERAFNRVLRLADGILLTCLAEPLSLRTLPGATAALRRACKANPHLQLLGILVNLFNPGEALQAKVLRRLRRTQRKILLEPPVPYQPAVAGWPLDPGGPIPPGPARERYAVAANQLLCRVGKVTAG
jgi:cellulose biosynthesis protein BcsQ